MNTSHLEGAVDEAKGKVKQAVGETFNDQKLANEGAVDEVKGHAKEAWGSVKDTAADVTATEKAKHEPEAEYKAHSIRESITDAAASAKEKIEHGLDSLKEKAHH